MTLKEHKDVAVEVGLYKNLLGAQQERVGQLVLSRELELRSFVSCTVRWDKPIVHTKSIFSKPLSLLVDHSMRVGGLPSRMHCLRYVLLLSEGIATLVPEFDAMVLMTMRTILVQISGT